MSKYEVGTKYKNGGYNEAGNNWLQLKEDLTQKASPDKPCLIIYAKIQPRPCEMISKDGDYNHLDCLYGI